MGVSTIIVSPLVTPTHQNLEYIIMKPMSIFQIMMQWRTAFSKMRAGKAVWIVNSSGLNLTVQSLYSRPFYSLCKWVLWDKKRAQAADPAIRLQIYPCPPADPGLSAAHGPMRKMKTLACLLQKNSPPAAIPLHFLQLHRSTPGGVIAELAWQVLSVYAHMYVSHCWCIRQWWTPRRVRE